MNHDDIRTRADRLLHPIYNGTMNKESEFLFIVADIVKAAQQYEDDDGTLSGWTAARDAMREALLKLEALGTNGPVPHSAKEVYSVMDPTDSPQPPLK